MKTLYDKACSHCGQAFSTSHRKQRFCSNTCSLTDIPRGHSQKQFFITLNDLVEAEEIWPASRLGHVAQKFGCTPSLVSYMAKKLGYTWKSHEREYGNRKNRREARKYAKATGCVVCGECRVVEAAHLIPRTAGADDNVENIIPLCPTHHTLYDRGLFDDRELELFIDFLYRKYPNLKEDFENERTQGNGLQSCGCEHSA